MTNPPSSCLHLGNLPLKTHTNTHRRTLTLLKCGRCCSAQSVRTSAGGGPANVAKPALSVRTVRV